MFESHFENNNFVAAFSASFENVDILCNEISRIMADYELSDQCFALNLIIREAANNAIVHGSGADQDKTVKVEINIEGKEISISVQDQGYGFDWRTRQHSVANPLVPSGRGMELMKTYASEVAFNETGNRVMLKMRI